MTRLALYLLGPPRIERDGLPIKVDTRKAIALLAYIAVTGESHRRASLINLLWPEYDHARGRAALRRTLYALRKALAGACLDVDGEVIGLIPGAGPSASSGQALWVDVDHFRRHLSGCETHGHPATGACPACAAALTKAVALSRGNFLSGFSLRDSFNFDDWQFFQADALRRELAGALERLVQWHSAQREFELAIGYARRWLALDPLDEQAHCQLMRVYSWSGQRSDALRQYEACARLLEEQLGVPPQEATTELYQAIQEGPAPPLAVDQPAKPTEEPAHTLEPPARPPLFLEGEEPVDRPVFVARELQLARLAGYLDSALAGRSQVVFVTGDAGCGKTALIQEFAWSAQQANPDLVVACGHGNAHTGAGDPYLPFREVLGLLTGDVGARWAAGAMTGEQARRLWHLLPLTVKALVEVGPDLIDLFLPGIPLLRRAQAYVQGAVRPGWLAQLEELVARKGTAPGNPNLQQSALFEQYTHVLRALASKKPLLLALDDLQWADAGSADLLFHLGRRMEGSRMLVVGAYRPVEVAMGRDSPARERHPLEPVVNEFKRTFGDIEVDLHQVEGRQFVDALLDSPASPLAPNRLGAEFRQTLHRHTAGYPLFTVELLRGMQERQDLLRDAEGRWVEGRELDWQMLPVRVEAVIAERIGRLPQRLQDILTVASVEGETFTAEVLATVEAVDLGGTIRCLSDTLDSKHRLVSAQGVSRVDDQNLSRYRFRHILFQKHLYNSLDPVKRVYLHQAVGTALEMLYGARSPEAQAATPQLARHFQEAGAAEKAVAYLHQAGERAQRLYANAEAVEYFQRALALLDGIPPDELRGSWWQEMASRLYESLGDVLEWTGEHDQARLAYQGALAYVPGDERLRQAHLWRKMGNVWRLQRQYHKALKNYDFAETALGEQEPRSTPEWWQEWIQIQLERIWMHYWLGQWREMSELAQIRPLVEQHGTPTQCVSFFLALASMNNRRDRYLVSEETLEFCQIALAISQESEDLGEIAWARFMLGFGQLWHGDLEEAEQQTRAALALAGETGDIVHQSRCLTYLTVLYRKRGELDIVRRHAAQSLEVAAAAQMIEYRGTAKANLAWIAWREGNLEGAEANGRAALELWQQLPVAHSSCSFQWTALWPLVAVAFAQDRVSEACELAQALLEPSQQHLPDPLAETVEQAVATWQEHSPQAARPHIERAIRLAQKLGYL